MSVCFEGVARRHYEGWAICDPSDPDPFHGVNPFGSSTEENLEGKRVRITVEVLEDAL